MVLIKRYPNRKLYDTVAKQYIALEGVAELVRQGSDIKVVDNTTGEDLTAFTLTQIILSQEKRRDGLLTHSFLTELIRSRGEQISALKKQLEVAGAILVARSTKRSKGDCKTWWKAESFQNKRPPGSMRSW